MPPTLRSLGLIAALVASTPLVTSLPAQSGGRPVSTAQALEGLDAWLERVRRDWDIPGMAVAIVRDTTVIYTKGFGLRDVGRNEPVTPSTIFAIASMSKAFTATMIGTLVDDKKLSWDDLAADRLPGFSLDQGRLDREATIRDLLSHRLGLARADNLWAGGYDYPSDSVLARVRALPRSGVLRGSFMYNNITYLAAGQIAARAAGEPWDSLVTKRLLRPLGMQRTTTFGEEIAGRAEVATPYGKVRDTLRVLPWTNIAAARPAGAINSTVLDISRWIRFQLDSGRAAGQSLVSIAQFRQTHTPHTIAPRDSLLTRANPFTHLSTYGLGWWIHDYRGREMLYHGGNVAGMSSMVSLLPEERLGVVILTNMDGTLARDLIPLAIYDRFLGVTTAPDWNVRYLAVRDERLRTTKRQEAARDSARARGTSPRAADAYVGVYTDALYGRAVVSSGARGLQLAVSPRDTLDLSHWHYDTFMARGRGTNATETLVQFIPAADGRIDRLEIQPLTGRIADTPAWRRSR